jgi:excisionase family DNA binding protein
MSTNLEDYMTTAEAAEVLGISSMSVARLASKSILRGKKYGPAWMIEKTSVEEYYERTKDKGPNDPTRTRKEAD